MFFLIFLFFIWGGWSSRITGNTQTWKILSSNPTDGIGQDGPGDPHYEASDNLQVGHVARVSLTVSYPLFFLCISKFSRMLYHGSVGWFHSKEWYLNRVQPPTPFSCGGRGLNLQPSFQKGELDRASTFRGGCW